MRVVRRENMAMPKNVDIVDIIVILVVIILVIVYNTTGVHDSQCYAGYVYIESTCVRGYRP